MHRDSRIPETPFAPRAQAPEEHDLHREQGQIFGVRDVRRPTGKSVAEMDGGQDGGGKEDREGLFVARRPEPLEEGVVAGGRT